MTTMQLSFGDAEHTGKHKKTRREVFLAEMGFYPVSADGLIKA